jgi:hypothetical protein
VTERSVGAIQQNCPAAEGGHEVAIRHAMAALAWLPDEDTKESVMTDLEASSAVCATARAAGSSTSGDTAGGVPTRDLRQRRLLL